MNNHEMKELKKYKDDILKIAYVINFGIAKYCNFGNETVGMGNETEIAEQLVAEYKFCCLKTSSVF